MQLSASPIDVVLTLDSRRFAHDAHDEQIARSN
jgi:hypothetical protein